MNKFETPQLNTPKVFWKKLQGTIAMHDMIQKTRAENVIANNTKNKITKIKDEVKDLEYQVGLDLIINSTKSFHSIFRRLFLDISDCRFKQTNSVNSEYDTHLIEYNNRFKLLKDINLYSHTINVVVETLKLTEKLPQKIKDIAILLPVLHDFGKNDKIAKEYMYEKKNKEKHHRISANYAKFVLHDESIRNKEVSKDLIDMIYSLLREHHEDEKQNNLFLQILTQADMNAREQELIGILKHGVIK